MYGVKQAYASISEYIYWSRLDVVPFSARNSVFFFRIYHPDVPFAVQKWTLLHVPCNIVFKIAKIAYIICCVIHDVYILKWCNVFFMSHWSALSTPMCHILSWIEHGVVCLKHELPCLLFFEWYLQMNCVPWRNVFTFLVLHAGSVECWNCIDTREQCRLSGVCLKCGVWTLCGSVKIVNSSCSYTG